MNEWVDENTRRQIFLDILYDTYGRNDPEHPKHGHYTGLWEDFLYEEAGKFARDQFFLREKMKAEVLMDIEEKANDITEQQLRQNADVG